MNEVQKRTPEVIAAAIDAGEAVEAEEAVALVRSITRHCRGPFRPFTEGRKAVLLKDLAAHAGRALEAEDAAGADAYTAAHEAVTGLEAEGQDGGAVRAALLAAGHLQAASLADAALRQHCGADVNDLILAGPLDGEEHTAACPRCGLALSYRAPAITLQEVTP